jgi:hemolysin III
MNTSQTLSKPYSTMEEWLNTISHGLGFLAAIVGFVFLSLKAEGLYAHVVITIYATSMLLMFLSSTLYHACRNVKLKQVFKVIDHSAIYLLIAGTYTPFMLLSVGGWLGIGAMILIWSIALTGVLFKCFAARKYPKLSVITYLLMGWLALFFIYPLYLALSATGLWLLVCGGLCYTVGVLFYVAKQVQYTHAIWHTFVVGGCMCHYFAIYYAVL